MGNFLSTAQKYNRQNFEHNRPGPTHTLTNIEVNTLTNADKYQPTCVVVFTCTYKPTDVESFYL